MYLYTHMDFPASRCVSQVWTTIVKPLVYIYFQVKGCCFHPFPLFPLCVWREKAQARDWKRCANEICAAPRSFSLPRVLSGWFPARPRPALMMKFADFRSGSRGIFHVSHGNIKHQLHTLLETGGGNVGRSSSVTYCIQVRYFSSRTPAPHLFSAIDSRVCRVCRRRLQYIACTAVVACPSSGHSSGPTWVVLVVFLALAAVFSPTTYIHGLLRSDRRHQPRFSTFHGRFDVIASPRPLGPLPQPDGDPVLRLLERKAPPSGYFVDTKMLSPRSQPHEAHVWYSVRRCFPPPHRMLAPNVWPTAPNISAIGLLLTSLPPPSLVLRLVSAVFVRPIILPDYRRYRKR